MITNCKLIWAKGLKSRFVSTASGWTKPKPNPVLKAPKDTIQTLQCEITIFLDDFMSFSHYWGGFCVHFNNVAHFTEVWGRLFALPQCFSQVEIQTFHHISLFLFQTFLLPNKNFPSRENQQGSALFSNVFWLHVLLIRTCASLISTLRHKSRSGCCVVGRRMQKSKSLLVEASQPQQPLRGQSRKSLESFY